MSAGQIRKEERRRLKILKRMLGILICIGIIFVFPAGTAEAVTNDSIKEKEAEIDSARKEVEGLKSNLTDIEAVKRNWSSPRVT